MSNKNNIAPVNRRWIERKGGVLLSICFHLILFSFLMTRYPELMIFRDVPKPLSLLLNLSSESDVNELPSFTPAPSTFQEQEKSGEPSPETQDNTRENTGEKLIYPEQPRISEYRTGIEETERELDHSLNDIQNAIERRSLNLKGTRAGFDSSGAEEGTVRVLDVGNVAQKISERVLQRYRIRITQKFISGDNEVYFLNKVQVQGKTFFSGNASGYYEVFEIPMDAVKKMTELENTEFTRRRLDPSNTRVKKIVFGIVYNDGEYDLGITHFEYEVIN